MNLSISVQKEGITLNVTVAADAQIGDLKRAVAAEKKGIDHTQVRFLLNGKFSDNDEKLSDLGIKDGDKLHAMISTVVYFITS